METETGGTQQPELKDCKVEFNSRTQEFFISIFKNDSKQFKFLGYELLNGCG